MKIIRIIKVRIYDVDIDNKDITHLFDYYLGEIFDGKDNIIIPRVGEYIEETSSIKDCKYQVLAVVYDHTYHDIIIRIYVKNVNLEKVIKELSPIHKEEL